MPTEEERESERGGRGSIRGVRRDARRVGSGVGGKVHGVTARPVRSPPKESAEDGAKSEQQQRVASEAIGAKEDEHVGRRSSSAVSEAKTRSEGRASWENAATTSARSSDTEACK
ncbi:hypothetical protein OF846_000568 [Rhodotorula toruloides]|nr:hypothetical protein OF846_000568 [Rhodotorula toruloides]